MDEALGTSDLAKILKCAARTVAKLCDRGRLRCWKIPGSRHRRVLLADLIAFMRANGYPEDMIPASPPADSTPEAPA